MNAVQTFQLTKRYRGRPACDAITLTVREGEIFGFLGPNGAGKSTFVRMLTGLVRPDHGGARILGRAYDDPEARRRVGYLPELFRYPPWLTAFETLGFHADLLGRRMTVSMAGALLERVGLGQALHQRVESFSKGMQQRLGLAVALVGDPVLLFLDEPTSAMDPVGRHDVAQLLRELRQDGVTVFLNSHLLSELEGLCDTVALIHRGRLLEVGPLNDVVTRAAEPRWRIVAGPLTDAAVQALAPWPVRCEETSTGSVLWFTGARGDLPTLHRLLDGTGVAVYEVEAHRGRLEDWFIDSVRNRP
jgi:ABC-2 type transport system ATP-binding protein